MRDRVKFFSPQNTAGVLQENGIAAISQTIEANGDQVSNVKKKNPKHNKTIKCLHTAPPHTQCEARWCKETKESVMQLQTRVDMLLGSLVQAADIRLALQLILRKGNLSLVPLGAAA